MYLNKDQLLEIFTKLQPDNADDGKTAKERTSTLFRFLAFDHLCKINNAETLSFPSDHGNQSYTNRQNLIEAYANIGTLKNDAGHEIIIAYFGKLEKGRSAGQKVGNDFLTAQLRQAQDTSHGKDYPSRPSHILKLGGQNSWTITKHSDWQQNLTDFIGPKNSSSWSLIAQFLFRNHGSQLDSLKKALVNYFSPELADYWIDNLLINNLYNGKNEKPVLDAELVSDLLLQEDPPAPIEKQKQTPQNIEDSDLLRLLNESLNTIKLMSEECLTLRLISSLSSKPFLILTGLSGSGKTKLAQAFAHWITPSPTEEGKNPHIALVAVGADWTGNDNILGYPNGLEADKYMSTKALDLILHAKKEENKDVPHFLILDEMNLSHVERYFADILSAIESDEALTLHGDSQREAQSGIPQTIKLPKNLYIIGTVNVDETTYMFSPKVLDRANVIEFSMTTDDLATFLKTPSKPDISQLAGAGASYGAGFVTASQSTMPVPDGVKSEFDAQMLKFFNTLSDHGAEFGYRVAYEASRFMGFYQTLGGHDAASSDWFDAAFDAVIVQKFLPKLHGSSNKLGILLDQLWQLCLKTEDLTETGGGEQEAKIDKDIAISQESANSARFPMSANKIYRMHRLLELNGFASFAEA